MQLFSRNKWTMFFSRQNNYTAALCPKERTFLIYFIFLSILDWLCCAVVASFSPCSLSSIARLDIAPAIFFFRNYFHYTIGYHICHAHQLAFINIVFLHGIVAGGKTYRLFVF